MVVVMVDGETAGLKCDDLGFPNKADHLSVGVSRWYRRLNKG